MSDSKLYDLKEHVKCSFVKRREQLKIFCEFVLRVIIKYYRNNNKILS